MDTTTMVMRKGKDISKVLLRDHYAIIEKKRDIDKFVDRFQVYFVIWIVFSYKLSYRISGLTRLSTVWDSLVSLSSRRGRIGGLGGENMDGNDIFVTKGKWNEDADKKAVEKAGRGLKAPIVLSRSDYSLSSSVIDLSELHKAVC